MIYAIFNFLRYAAGAVALSALFYVFVVLMFCIA